MTSYSKLFKRIFLALLLILLVLPAVQARFPLFKAGALGGYTEQTPHPSFSWADLLDSSYQPALEKYVEDQIGFREALIRLRNQLAFSVFNVCKANDVLVGKNNILLDEVAIRSYLGQDYKGQDAIRVDVRKLKAVQDTLARRGILLVFAIAPAKASFYPEYHPEYFQKQPHTQSNYTAYAQQMQQENVNLVDLAQVFKQWKDTASYPLFTRGGIHWSGYGITLAADTLFRYIEQRGHFNLPDHSITGQTVTDQPRDSDDDIVRSLNLIKSPEEFPMAYPDIKFEQPKTTQKKPNMLMVGDSFGWGLITFYPFIPNLFSEKTQFWYYNMQVQRGARDDMSPGREVYMLDRKAEMLAQDVILLLYTQRNLGSFDNGFSSVAYDLFFPHTSTDISRIQAIEQKLKDTPGLQDKLWEQASATNRDYSQLLHDMAVKEYDLQRF